MSDSEERSGYFVVPSRVAAAMPSELHNLAEQFARLLAEADGDPRRGTTSFSIVNGVDSFATNEVRVAVTWTPDPI